MLQQIISLAIATPSMFNEFQHTSSVVKIGFIPTKEWVVLDGITSGTIEFEDKTKQTDAGEIHDQKIKAEIPTHKLPNHLMAELGRNSLILRLTYNDGKIEIIGCKEFPVRFQKSASVKQSSYHALEFTCNTIYEAFRLIL